MGIVVQKFGGTSLNDATSQKSMILQVEKAKKEGHDLVVVVSAMGRFGAPYATDTLVNMLNVIDEDTDLRNKDLIMSCGEIISSTVVSDMINSNGMDAVALTGFQAGILTDDSFSNARILSVDTSRILKFLEQGKIVVVAGFQGATEEMDITTLGRGGSDVTAVTLGGYLHADRVDIFTDVPGIAVIDPKIVSNPPYIRNINYNTIYNYASHGAKVIHPEAILIGQKYDIPIYIRTASIDNTYTIISNNQTENKKIIGMGVDVGNDPGYISVFLNSDNDKLKERVYKCVLSNMNLETEIKWHDNYLLIHMGRDEVLPSTVNLYKCFKFHKLI